MAGTKKKPQAGKVEASLTNANKLLSKIPIRFRDENKFLEYTMYSLIRLDEDCDVNLFNPETLQSIFPELSEKIIEGNLRESEVAELLFKSLKPRFVTQLLWAGLVSKDPDLTLDEVAKEFDAMTLPQIIQNIGSIQLAVNAAMPGEGEQKKS